MVDVAPKALINKVNPLCLKALEGAIGMCVSNTNATVEMEHWLLKLLEPANSDLTRIFKHFDVDTARVTREVQKSLEKLRRGHDRSPSLSQDLLEWIGDAWQLATLGFERGKIRTAHLLGTAVTNRSMLNKIRDITPELGNAASKMAGVFNVSDVNLQRQSQMNLSALLAGSVEDEMDQAIATAPGAAPGAPGQPGQVAPGSKTPNLDQFTMNLTAQAKKGMDPVIGRDFEIRQVIDILTRRRQNNPILTGEAGVGKTAVVEGFAMAVVKGEVPVPLRNVEVRTLDLGLLQAGAGVKGEFENRLKSIIQEVKSSPTPIILFIDEAHTLIGAGGAAGQGDAANLLKPALARGEMRTIAATTRMEYKKYFESDPALKRRFQEVKVDEPDIAKAIRMMRGLADVMEGHHKVRVLDDAVAEAVKLSHRYITDRQLPDKCVSLLDTACARVALSQSSTPPQVQDAQREIELLDVELKTLEKETSLGTDHSARVADLTEKKKAVEDRLAVLQKRWTQEKELAVKIKELYEKLTAHFNVLAGKPKAEEKNKLSAADEKKAKEELTKLEAELTTVQGENPLVLPLVAGQAVAEVVSGWTGVPLGKMVRDEIKTVLTLRDRLKERVIGQDHGLEAIAQRIRTSRANLADPKRPLGVFLLVGPSGVGKTETAIALAEILFGGDRNMVVINMSEYKEDHKISRLTGSAPGYVGYGEGGVLTEAVRRKPYSVVLLDEIEKANESVQEIFYQVFDKGTLQDDKGNEINFKNTIIILTSNVGTDTIMKVCADPETRPEPEGLAEAMRPDLLKSFKPALLGRMAIVPFYPLNDEMLRAIIGLKLKHVVNRMKENHKATLAFDDNLISTIASRCKEVESGARNVDHIIAGTLLPELAQQVLSSLAEGKSFTKAQIGVGADGKFTYTLE
jgi:type VI secretion system protein VasG